MSVVDDTTNVAIPMTHARIGYDKIFGTITASSEANGFPATAADNPLTYTGWKPNALPATWQIDAGTAQDVDYVGIAAHTLGSSFCKVKVQYSDNGSDWLDASSPHRPNDDSPILFLFDEQEARYWRIYVNSINLVAQSIPSASWWKHESVVDIEPNAAIAPDGTMTATRVNVPANAFIGPQNNFSPVVEVGRPYTFSIWVKSATGAVQPGLVWIEDNAPGFTTAQVAFTVTTEWQRVSVTAVVPEGTADFRCSVRTGHFYLWGAQLEQGTFPTSFIKTEGATSDIPFVGVIYIGKVLAMQRAIYGGHSPVTLSRETTIRPTVSERGQWLGRSIIRGGLVGSWTWRHLNADWYREHFDRFVKAARERPFFIAWRPETFPNEVAYCWTQKDIVPSNMGIKDFMQVTVEAVGVE